MKNPQFLSNQADIQAILPTHELIILTKFHKDCQKIVYFSVIAKFWASLIFLHQSLWILMLLRWEKLYKHWFFSKQHQMALSWIALSSTVKRQRRFWILNMTDNAQWQYLIYQTNSLMQNWTTLYIYIHYWSILFYYFLCTALTIKCIISGHVLSSFTILYTR